MKHIFIINPTAGKTDSRQKIYDMAESLRQKHGLDVQCILTKKQGHATELAKKLCETGEALRFYACGGDGTVNEVANGIIGYDNAAMTVIPVGTGNDFLKNFGDDMEKFREVMSELAEAETTEVKPDYFGDSYYDTDGNATLIKSERIVYNSEEMQFIAVTTKDGHVFYVLINYSAENAEDQVFFLNNVRNTYGHYKLLE